MASGTTLELEDRASGLSGEEPLYEVVNGQQVELPPMSIYAALIASRLLLHMDPFVRSHKLGCAVAEALFILDSKKNLRRRPDVAFISADRWPLDRELPETGDWEVVPTLAVEVISPTDTFEEVHTKIEDYFRAGVNQVWLILPLKKQVHVYDAPTQPRTLSGNQDLDGGAILLGFRLSLVELFQRTP